jgi:acyl dehydratase
VSAAAEEEGGVRVEAERRCGEAEMGFVHLALEGVRQTRPVAPGERLRRMGRDSRTRRAKGA